MGFLQQHRVAGDDTGNTAEQHGTDLDAAVPSRGVDMMVHVDSKPLALSFSSLVVSTAQ